jgi:hypothetical protein
MKVAKLLLKPLKSHEINCKNGLTYFAVYDNNKRPIYSRIFEKKVYKFSFNQPYYLPENYFYVNNPNCEIINYSNIKLPNFKPNFKPKENINVIVNYHLNGTPARIFVKENKIEVSTDFLNLPRFQKEFIFWHEMAHTNNLKEDQTDKNALYYYIKSGFNFTQALNTLATVLKASPERLERLNNIYNLSLKK